VSEYTVAERRVKLVEDAKELFQVVFDMASDDETYFNNAMIQWIYRGIGFWIELGG
jgi:hypothetical protein